VEEKRNDEIAVKTILLVDDNPSFVHELNESFHEHSSELYNIVWKTTIDDALAYLEGGGIADIILSDFYFASGTNALELCLALNEHQVKIPIVFLASVEDVQMAVDAMKLGVEDIILKEDIDFHTFPRFISGILDRARLRKSKQAIEKRLTMAENRAQAIRELVVTVCHEFNNPLAAVKISFDLLQRILTRDEEKQLLKKFEENYNRIESEIRRLRDMNFERLDGVRTNYNQSSPK